MGSYKHYQKNTVNENINLNRTIICTGEEEKDHDFCKKTKQIVTKYTLTLFSLFQKLKKKKKFPQTLSRKTNKFNEAVF